LSLQHKESSRAQRDAQRCEKDVNLSAIRDDQHSVLSVLRFILESSDAMPAAAPYHYVYVNADGTARELHAGERQYLETEFSGGDGAAPSIKSNYSERNGWGEIKGYLERSKLPAGAPIHDAPAEDPSRPLSRAEYIAWLRNKGVDVIENSDGSLTAMAKPRR
jgi:hypothetical protein